MKNSERKKAYIVSYPRSGNTWVRLLLEYAMGFPTTSVYPEEERARSKCSGSIPHTIRVVTRNDQHLVRPPSIDLIKSHDLSLAGSDPVIYVLRDGRDAIVSYWYYLRDFESQRPEEFSSFLRNLRKGSNWWGDHVYEWLVKDKRHPKLVVRFEDLLADQKTELVRMLDFVGLAPIRRFDQFESEMKFDNLRREMPGFFRTGRVGIWQEVFSGDDQQFFLANDRGLLSKLGYIKGEEVPAAMMEDGGTVTPPKGERLGTQDMETIKGMEEVLHCWCGGKLGSEEVPGYSRCHDCGTLSLRTRPLKEALLHYYRAEYWPSMRTAFGHPSVQDRADLDLQDRIPLWHRIIELFSPPPSRLLEIGAAHGGLLAYARDHGYEEVVGIEPDPAVAAFGRDKFQLEHLLPGFFPDVKLPSKQFDVVGSFDVLEHFLDPVGCLKAIHELLSNEGVFIFQTPCYRGEGSGWDQFSPEHRHIFLFNRESVQLLLQKTGFLLEAMLPGYYLYDVIFVARRQDTKRKLLSDPLAWAKFQSLYMSILDQRSKDHYSLFKDREGWVERFHELQENRDAILEEATRRELSLKEKEQAIQEGAKALREKEEQLSRTHKIAQERALALVEKEQEITATLKVAEERARALVEKEQERAATQKAASERANSLVEKEEEIRRTQRTAMERAQALIEKEGEIMVTQKAAEERARALLEKEEMIRALHDVAEERSRVLQLINEELERIKRHWVYRAAVHIKRMLEKMRLKGSS